MIVSNLFLSAFLSFSAIPACFGCLCECQIIQNINACILNSFDADPSCQGVWVHLVKEWHQGSLGHCTSHLQMKWHQPIYLLLVRVRGMFWVRKPVLHSHRAILRLYFRGKAFSTPLYYLITPMGLIIVVLIYQGTVSGWKYQLFISFKLQGLKLSFFFASTNTDKVIKIPKYISSSSM